MAHPLFSIPTDAVIFLNLIFHPRKFAGLPRCAMACRHLYITGMTWRRKVLVRSGKYTRNSLWLSQWFPKNGFCPKEWYLLYLGSQTQPITCGDASGMDTLGSTTSSSGSEEPPKLGGVRSSAVELWTLTAVDGYQLDPWIPGILNMNRKQWCISILALGLNMDQVRFTVLSWFILGLLWWFYHQQEAKIIFAVSFLFLAAAEH